MGISTSGHNGDADLDRAKEFMAKWGSEGCVAYNSYDELVANPDIDIIYIGTKTKDHCKHTLLSLEAGKPVLCEKPLAENAADAASMHAKAAEKGLFMQDAMWSRFFPATEHARTLIEQGAIGDVKVFQGDFGFSGMGQSAEDMEAKRAIHNPSMSCCESLARPPLGVASAGCSRRSLNLSTHVCF